jgi:hypothetical protein
MLRVGAWNLLLQSPDVMDTWRRNYTLKPLWRSCLQIPHTALLLISVSSFSVCVDQYLIALALVLKSRSSKPPFTTGYSVGAKHVEVKFASTPPRRRGRWCWNIDPLELLHQPAQALNKINVSVATCHHQAAVQYKGVLAQHAYTVIISYQAGRLTDFQPVWQAGSLA